MTTIVVLTRSRDGRFEYLESLLRQLDGAHVSIVVDVSDRTVEEEEAERLKIEALGPLSQFWFRRPDGTLFGNKLAYWRCFEVAIEGGGDGLIFEDDIELCTNAVRRMETFRIPADLGFVTFFAPGVFLGSHQFAGIWRTPTPVLGAQAIKFTRGALESLIAWRSDERFALYYQASDQALEFARRHLGISYGAHCPELVQHVGDRSEVTPGATLESPYRRARTFPGREFDALRLYVRDDLYR